MNTPPTPDLKVCPIHPAYKGFRPPKSKRYGCICQEIWRDAKEKKGTP